MHGYPKGAIALFYWAFMHDIMIYIKTDASYLYQSKVGGNSFSLQSCTKKQLQNFESDHQVNST